MLSNTTHVHWICIETAMETFYYYFYCPIYYWDQRLDDLPATIRLSDCLTDLWADSAADDRGMAWCWLWEAILKGALGLMCALSLSMFDSGRESRCTYCVASNVATLIVGYDILGTVCAVVLSPAGLATMREELQLHCSVSGSSIPRDGSSSTPSFQLWPLTNSLTYDDWADSFLVNLCLVGPCSS